MHYELLEINIWHEEILLGVTEHQKDHTHDPIALRNELLERIQNGDLRIEFLITAATPLVSVAMSASVLTFLSLQFYLNGSLFSTRLLAYSINN